jgi:hypothetical protein
MPNYDQSEKLVDTEVFELFKFLNCKFKIDKSCLKAVGAINTWGDLAKLLYWLYTVVRIYFTEPENQEGRISEVS